MKKFKLFMVMVALVGFTAPLFAKNASIEDMTGRGNEVTCSAYHSDTGIQASGVGAGELSGEEALEKAEKSAEELKPVSE